MTERARDVVRWIIGGLGAVALFLAGLLWNSSYDYIQRVDAKCIALDKEKASTELVSMINDRLDRIEKKIDRLR